MGSFEPLAETAQDLAQCMRDLADVYYAKAERNPGAARPSLDAFARPSPTRSYLRGAEAA
jgi:hypothetical protein